MIQMASVFGEQEREIIRSRVIAGLDRVRAARKEARAACRYPRRSRQPSASI